MTLVFFCDRCGNKIPNKDVVKIAIAPLVECERRFDLCKDCSNLLYDFIHEIKDNKKDESIS